MDEIIYWHVILIALEGLTRNSLDFVTQALVLLTDAQNVANSAALRDVAVSLAANWVKVVPVVVGGRREVERVKPLTTLEDYIVSVSSAERLQSAIRPTAEKILKGNLSHFSCH